MLTVGQILRLEALPICREDEFGLLAGRGRALPQGGERGGHLAPGADLEMDIITLEQAARDIGPVGVAAP